MIAYKPSAPDLLGRLYPFPFGAAKLPKELRHLLFGRTHTEIDLVSAHYQLFQRTAAELLRAQLPSAETLRTTLQTDMQRPPQTILQHFPEAPKRIPLFLLNSSLGETLDYLASLGYYPSFEVLNMLRTVQQVKPRLLPRLEHSYTSRNIPSSSNRNRCYFLLEHLESSWMKQFVSHLLRDFTHASLIWIHDGLWISPPPSQTLIGTANRLATSFLGLSSSPLHLKNSFTLRGLPTILISPHCWTCTPPT